MTDSTKMQIGQRLREKREQAGYTREKLGELCSLSPRFIANVEFGDATFSLNSLMNACRVLSCSSDYLLFGTNTNTETWNDTVERIKQLDPKYQSSINRVIEEMIEMIVKAENGSR